MKSFGYGPGGPENPLKLATGAAQLLWLAVRSHSGPVTAVALAASSGLAHAGISAVTGWMEISPGNLFAPIRFALRNPELDRGHAEAAQARRRLEEAEYRGEAIMREYLSLLIDSDELEDNARPGFLVNPITGERLELDRYYPPLGGALRTPRGPAGGDPWGGSETGEHAAEDGWTLAPAEPAGP